jgi:hypothetical protein
MRMALIQGMENTNKTLSHFEGLANGGFLERSFAKNPMPATSRRGLARLPMPVEIRSLAVRSTTFNNPTNTFSSSPRVLQITAKFNW